MRPWIPTRPILPLFLLTALLVLLAGPTPARTRLVEVQANRTDDGADVAVYAAGGNMIALAPTVHAYDDIVLFDGPAQAADFFAGHGDADPKAEGGFGLATKQTGTVMNAGAAGAGDAFLDAAIAEVMQGAVQLAIGPDYHAMYGVGTGVRAGSGTIGSTVGSTPVRYVAASALPLRAAPVAGADVIREMGAGERVFVLPTLPQIDASANLVFVEVQAVDVSPYDVGWMPLHWLYDTNPRASEDDIEFRPSYAFLAKQLAKGVESAFYGYWCTYPETPHSAFDASYGLPEPTTQGQAGCGELPVGVATAYGHRLVLDQEHTIGGYTDDVVVHTRFSKQRRSENGYEMLDLRENFFGVPDDVSTIREYSLVPGEESDGRVRVHDTDLWFNVSAAPPTGVVATGAEAYFNFCFQLPGVVLEIDPFRIDAEILGVPVGSVDPGAIGVEPMKVCATAAIDEREPGADWFTVGGAARPLEITWLRATVSNVGLYVEENISVNGGNGTAISQAVVDWAGSLMSAVVTVGAGHTPWIFDEYFAESVEGALVQVMNDLTSPVLDGLPDPEAWVKRSCDRFLGLYDDPDSRYYHLYRHCVDATEPVEIELFADGGPDPASVCHDPNLYARVNDGRHWSTWSDDQHAFISATGEQTWFDRPHWATECGVRSRLTTSTADLFWPVMHCLEDTLEETLTFDRFDHLASDAQADCLLPTLELLCNAYGDGDDLEAMWSSAGPLPAVSEYLGFCGFYEAVLDAQTEDGPAYAVE